MNLGILYISTRSLRSVFSSKLKRNRLIRRGASGRQTGCAHSSTGRDISVGISLFKPLDRVLFLLLEWEIVKVTADSILAVDTFLGDVEVLDVEEPLLANGSNEGVGEHLLAFRGGVEGEVDCDQIGPIEVGLQSRVQDRIA